MIRPPLERGSSALSIRDVFGDPVSGGGAAREAAATSAAPAKGLVWRLSPELLGRVTARNRPAKKPTESIEEDISYTMAVESCP